MNAQHGYSAVEMFSQQPWYIFNQSSCTVAATGTMVKSAQLQIVECL
jgi:hypothetical protein